MKVHEYSVEKCFSGKDVLPKASMDVFKFVVDEKIEFSNFSVINDNISGIFAGHKPEAKKKKQTKFSLLSSRQQLSKKKESVLSPSKRNDGPSPNWHYCKILRSLQKLNFFGRKTYEKVSVCNENILCKKPEWFC